jgi:hypothetical protein
MSPPDDPEPKGPDDAVERHKVDLVARAIEIARNRPELRIVGLVAEADAPEAQSLRAAPSEVLRGADGSVAAILTRESALILLGAATPGLLDSLKDEDGGPRRALPVIHAARRGMRTTTNEYDVPD